MMCEEMWGMQAGMRLPAYPTGTLTAGWFLDSRKYFVG
jgi:hypothetical protein